MAEIYVTSTADSGAGSLRQAIADASDGDVILFDADVFPVGQTTSILLSSYITVNKSISIYGGASDGDGGYTSGATKRFYVYRDVEGVKTKVIIDDDNPAQEGETVLFENVCRVALDGQGAVRCAYTTGGVILWSGIGFIGGLSATNGGGVYSRDTSQNTLNDCTFDGCSATSGGGVYSNNTSQNTLNDCTFDGCSATSGGGVCSINTSQNTLNDCIISGCSASNGGGVYSRDTSQNTLNDCTITDCSATSNGGGVYSTAESHNTLNRCTISFNTAALNTAGLYAMSLININDCVFTDNDAIILGTAQGVINASKFDALTIGGLLGTTTNVTIVGITTIKHSNIRALGAITIADGAALTITDSATIGAAKFTSSGRGYLAVGAGIDTSAATLTNVVLCAYGADVSSFAEVDGVLEWSAANPTTTVLIERADGDSWSTVTQPTGESLTLYLPPSDTVRLFDGVQFFVATAPSQRTYYYIGSSEGSFTSAADWSLRRGGVAITEPPVVAGQRFIVGDIEDAQEE